MFAAVCMPSARLAAQVYPGGNSQNNAGLNGSLSHEDLEKLNGDHQKDADAEQPRDPELASAKVRAQSEQLLKTLQIACAVSNAQLVVSGTRKAAADGKSTEARVYEVACSGDFGYLLETQGDAAPIGISCLQAEEARAKDVAKGMPPGFFCRLPENKDVYGTVTALISESAGAACTVKDLQWYGRSTIKQIDYSEVVCSEGGGFLLLTPQPGSQVRDAAISCADAAKRGIRCHLTDAGPVEAAVTMETFKTSLADHGVACRIDQIRMIGQEDHLKRYVVEYRCADQADAMVAFIPLKGNTTPYEAIGCAKAAVENGIICEYQR
jgi:hypothetical protein